MEFSYSQTENFEMEKLSSDTGYFKKPVEINRGYVMGVICPHPNDWNKFNISAKNSWEPIRSGSLFVGNPLYLSKNLALLALFMDVPLSFCCVIPCASSILKKKQELFPLCVHSHNDQDNSYALLKGQIISKAIFVFLISPKKRTKKI